MATAIATHLPRARVLRQTRGVALRICVVAGIFVAWQLLALTVFAGRYVVPTPTSVWSTMVHNGFFGSDLVSTLSTAWKGWLFGNGAALAVAALVLLAPALESLVVTIGVATYCVPTIAVGPIFVVLYGNDGAKAVMSALSVFFVTLVAAITGLRTASDASIETVRAFGGSRWDELVKVRVRASIPMLAQGLSISAPAAILGTMIGDYLGAQHGLGVILLQAQQQLDVERTWAIAAVSTLACGAAFAATSLLARLVSGGYEAAVDSGVERSAPTRAWPVAVPLGIAKAVLVLGVGLGAWELLVRTSGLSDYFVKSPADVVRYLWGSPDGPAHLSAMSHALARTLADGAMGWAVGTIVAVVLSYTLVLVPATAAAVMPFVVIMRSVPLIALCPLLGLVFGRGWLGVTVIGGLVTFVPTVVTLVGAFRETPSSVLDVVHCAGGGPRQALVKVRTPYAAPALFAAAKISMPGAVLGAVLAEWLITAHGLGHMMSIDIISSDYGNLFAAIAALLTVSLALYGIVGALEGAVRRAMGGM